jgi:hypothetical protein
LNHLGFRLADSAELVEWQRRLEMAGIATQREEGVECCYARQTKFWVRDPDNNLWEIYVLEEDIEYRGIGQAPGELPPPVQQSVNPGAPAKAIWQHQIGTPLPTKIFALDDSTAEVHLRGSFNSVHNDSSRHVFMAEVFRILQGGGTVSLHMLTGSEAIAIPHGTLPGPASYVTHVPALDELLTELTAAGFEAAQLTKYGSRPCFTQDGIEMRETMLVARKPIEPKPAAAHDVVYLGPLASVRDDRGIEFPRGQRVTVPEACWQALSAGPLAQSFVSLDRDGHGGCSA